MHGLNQDYLVDVAVDLVIVNNDFANSEKLVNPLLVY